MKRQKISALFLNGVLLCSISCAVGLFSAAAADGATIKGTVKDKNSAGIAGVSVIVFGSDGVTWIATAPVTDSSGSYMLTDSKLTVGTSYKLCFWAYETDYVAEWYSTAGKAYWMENATPVTLSSDPFTVNNVQLDLGGKISGHVYYKRNMQPVTSALILVHDSTGLHDVGFALAKGDGSYTVPGLLGGNAKVQFFETKGTGTKPGAGLNEWYDDKRTLSTADALSVTVGVTSPLNSALLGDQPNLAPVYYRLDLLTPVTF